MKRLALFCVPLLFLPAAFAQDLADAKGKEPTERICGACHDAGVVTKYHYSKDDWQGVIDDMKGRGADGMPEDFATIVDYLTHFYGPEVNVNKASAADIQAQLGLTSDEAAAIVKYRQSQGKIKDFADLKQAPGVDAKKLEPLQQRIVFESK